MKIIICPTCDGKGDVEEDVGTHCSEYVYSICDRCHGTGRVKVLHIEYALEISLEASESSLYETVEKISEIIKDFKRTANVMN